MTHKTTETGTARELILQRLRQARPAAMPMPDVSALYGQQLHEDHMTRVERLVLNLTNAMAQVHRTTWAALPKSLADVVRDQQLVSVALGPELLDDAAVCAALGTTTHVLPVTTVHGEQAALFNEVAAGVTLSRAAIAETGTVVLWSGPQSPRLLSLVPPVHIVIVDAHTVYDTLSEVMHAERWSDGLPTNVILVSSPSKTADIQQTLAYGAHGPKQLIVMLVEDVR